MNLKRRADMVRAMNTIVRSINDEDIIMSWLMVGVADGDVKEDTPDDYLEYYCEDETFAELMALFLRLMKRAEKDGLYCDKVVSK